MRPSLTPSPVRPLLARLVLGSVAVALVAPGTSASAARLGATDSTAYTVASVVVDRAGAVSVRRSRVAGLGAASRLAADLRDDAGVVATGVDVPVRALATDPRRGDLWAHDLFGAEALWTAGDATGQVVAVVDTGVDATHPDLDDVVLPGWDGVTTGADGRTDPNGHGTHVAGTVAAEVGNGVAVAGLARGAKVLPVRALRADGSGFTSTVAAGVVWAANNGAHVVNLSLGGGYSSLLAEAVAYAQSKDVVVVAAAGNSGTAAGSGDPVEYPAALPGVLAVAAVDRARQRPTFSSTGAHLSLAAPGVSVLSTWPGGRTAWANGTSMAAPHVAAAAALVRARRPQATQADVVAALRSTAVDVQAPGPDPHSGSGLPDVTAATAALPAPSAPAEPAPAQPQPAPPSPSQPAPAVTEPAPPAQPAPADPAPSAPAPPAPAPSAPLPSEPLPSAPAPTEPAPSVPAPSAPAPPVVKPVPVAGPAPAVKPAPPTRRPAVARMVLWAPDAPQRPGRTVVVVARALQADGRPAAGVTVQLIKSSTGRKALVVGTARTDAAGVARWRVAVDRTATLTAVAGRARASDRLLAARRR